MAINSSTLEQSYDGSPFTRITAKVGIGNNTLELSYDGEPWWLHEPPASTGHIKSINGVAWAHVKTYNGVAQAHIKTALGIEG